uniref:Ribosomal protein S11 n=1 Tax=Cladosiphon okamuranus TaxID=309737 RepID=A0A3G5FPN5_9PHAE|nr:ribosomal protein S11 [Cladosiphon okamuranus]AYW52599.1 ribosomal protein S11 [Cladosiphon okamuranus]
MLIKSFLMNFSLKQGSFFFSSFSKSKSKILKAKSPFRRPNKRGSIYIKSTKSNLFCTLMDVKEKKVKTSCSLKVPEYDNEFNEKVNPFKRGKLLGEVFGKKTRELGFTEVGIYLDSNMNQARKGFLQVFGRKKIKISFIQLSKAYPHNGCRPSKVRRKKLRTKVKSR